MEAASWTVLSVVTRLHLLTMLMLSVLFSSGTSSLGLRSTGPTPAMARYGLCRSLSDAGECFPLAGLLFCDFHVHTSAVEGPFMGHSEGCPHLSISFQKCSLCVPLVYRCTLLSLSHGVVTCVNSSEPFFLTLQCVGDLRVSGPPQEGLEGSRELGLVLGGLEAGQVLSRSVLWSGLCFKGSLWLLCGEETRRR